VAALLLICLVMACGDDSDSSTDTPSPTEGPSATANTPEPSPKPDEPPVRDLLDLARRFRGYPHDSPSTARTEPYNHQVGETEEFVLTDLVDTSEYTVAATVRAVTDHAYFFVQDDAGFTQSALDEIAQDFESDVWPDITSSFGEPPTPGVDADPRITILHADLRGAGGYVSASNEYPAAAVPNSAEREILYVDQSLLSSPGAEYNSLVAHELQHLVHLAGDRNEESWVNEGLSEVAWEIAGGGTDGVLEFLDRPDTQLTTWPYVEDVGVHYSASELFFGYLLDQYGGRENAQELNEQQGNGIAGVEAYLEKFGKTFNEVFADFAVANILDTPSGIYAHPSVDATTTDISSAVPGDEGDETVHQYGTDYYEADGDGTFEFDGAEEVTIGIPELDGAFWWSGRSDGIDSRLTRKVDLTGVSSATLTFDLWHDIEPGWDYGYVAASTDEGRTWKALPGDLTSSDDPVGQSYGPAYTGESDGWVRETVDLTDYAGATVLLRFEYITDDATNLTGMAVDNIAIEDIGFSDGADDTSGWDMEGFRRIEGPMEQEFIVQVIDGEEVTSIDLDTSNSASFAIPAGAIIAISGATPSTTELAPYNWSLRP